MTYQTSIGPEPIFLEVNRDADPHGARKPNASGSTQWTEVASEW